MNQLAANRFEFEPNSTDENVSRLGKSRVNIVGIVSVFHRTKTISSTSIAVARFVECEV